MEKIIGKRLKQAREGKGLTQVEIKQMTNINNKTLSGYENGVSEPDIGTLKTLSNLYGTSVDYLIGNTDDPTPPQSKQEKPTPKEYVLSVKTLADAAIRIAELLHQDLIDGEEYLMLNELAYNKFGLSPVKGGKGSPPEA